MEFGKLMRSVRTELYELGVRTLRGIPERTKNKNMTNSELKSTISIILFRTQGILTMRIIAFHVWMILAIMAIEKMNRKMFTYILETYSKQSYYFEAIPEVSTYQNQKNDLTNHKKKSYEIDLWLFKIPITIIIWRK